MTARLAASCLPWGLGHTAPWPFGAFERLRLWAPSGMRWLQHRGWSSLCTGPGLVAWVAGTPALGQSGHGRVLGRRGPGQCLSRDGTPHASPCTRVLLQV